MLRLDEFESVFKKAKKTKYHYQDIPIRTALLMTDLDETGTDALRTRVKSFLSVLPELELTVAPADAIRTIQGAVDLVNAQQPDLVVSYRHLFETSWDAFFSLGGHIDSLTQTTQSPVLVLPHPNDDRVAADLYDDTRSVVVVTDHLTGDDRLVNFSIKVTAEGGRMSLTHIEGQTNFEYYMGIIEKLPSLDTETARHDIKEQLLKEPHDYVTHVRETLEEKKLPIEVDEVVRLGHRVPEYKKLVEQHRVNLMVLNTKDESQVAMHPLAYPIAIEFVRTPLLML